MQLSDNTFDRDRFIEALATWLKWRGHSVPHHMLAQRLTMSESTVSFADLQKAVQQIGIHFTVKKRKQLLPDAKNFPLIAVIGDREVRAIRQIDMQGRLVASQVGGESAIVPVDDITAWIEVQLSSKKLHQEIFGTDHETGRWFWDAFSANWWAYLQGALATAFASFLGLASAVYSMQV